MSIQVKDNGIVLVRAPKKLSDNEIKKIIDSKKSWILKHLNKLEFIDVDKLSEEEIKELRIQAMDIIPRRVKYYASKMGVEYGSISIRMQKTRWGSCSSKKNLNFNLLLMLTPIEVIDSVVVHELCHLKEMNHSKTFYNEVYKYYPAYDIWHRWLKDNEKKIMRKVY